MIVNIAEARQGAIDTRLGAIGPSLTVIPTPKEIAPIGASQNTKAPR